MRKWNVKNLLPVVLFAITAAFVAVACTDELASFGVESDESFVNLRAENETLNILPEADSTGDVDSSDFCFAINYPITLVYPDGTTAELTSDDEFLTTIRTWKEDNPDAEMYPTLQFPVTVTLADGTTQDLNDEEAARQLFEDCFGDRDDYKHCKRKHRKDRNCEGGDCDDEDDETVDENDFPADSLG